MTPFARKSVRSTWFLGAVFTLVVCLTLPTALWSQAASGSIAGYVYDPTGAVVPDAEVQAINVETGQVRTVRSDASGRYFLGQLSVGRYELTISRQGFADLRRTNISLQIGAALEIDATLQLAGVQGSTSVIVESEIRELPVNNRNWTELALLTPGVNVDAEFDSVASVSINGQEGVFNNIQVDGVDNNNSFFAEVRGRTRAPFQFSQETVKEFRVMNTAYSAEHGRAAGGVINAVTKSGTNNFHGSVFWYLRDDAFNATPFFSNAQGIPKADSRRQQFGGTIGGPLAQDKAFFFFSYDQQVRRDPATIILDTDSASDLAFNPLDIFNIAPGDSFTSGSNSFTDAVDGTGSRQLVNDATTGFSGFHSDIIHQAFLDWAFARAWFLGDTSFLGQTFTTPAGTLQTASFSGSTFNPVARIVPRDRDQINFFPKVTVLLNDSHTLNLQYNFQDFDAGPNGIFTNPTKTDNGDGREKNRSDSLSVGVSSVFSPTLLNEFRFQFSRDDATTDNSLPGVPEIDMFSMDLGAQGFVPRFTKEDKWQFRDDFSWIKGRHSVKFGFDFVVTLDDNFFPGDFNGEYNFNGPGNWIELSRTLGGRDLFGIDVGAGQGPRSPTGRFTLSNYQQRFGRDTTEQTTVDYGLYVQDNIRLSPKFTLNLGLRYEFQKLEDPVLPNPLVPQTAFINEDENNFAPRIGLAWSPRENLVVRAGYGLFYIRTGGLDVDNALKNNNAFSFNQFFSSSFANSIGLLDFNPAALDPTNFQDSDFPEPTQPTRDCPATPSECADPFASVNFFSPDRENGYTQQSSLEIQWEFYPQHSLSVGYVHTKGTGLPRNRNINVPAAPQDFRVVSFFDEGGNLIRTMDVQDYDITGFGGSFDRPNPNFSGLNVNESGASSFYNAFTAAFERRWHKGLVAGVTYTLSKNVTDIANGFNSGGSFFSDVFDQNNASLDRGLSRLDERHYFVTRVVWEPEFWRDSSGAARWVLDGWSYGFIYTGSSGRFITPAVDDDINRDNARTAFGDGDRVPFLGRGTFNIQGRNNFDLSVYKRFRFGEGKSLQFRFQAFNLFNRTFFTRFDDVMFNLFDGDDPRTTGVVEDLFAVQNDNFLLPEGRARRNRDIQFGLVFRF
jgi:outer membrane receptor protein involved in Fe transport